LIADTGRICFRFDKSDQSALLVILEAFPENIPEKGKRYEANDDKKDVNFFR